MSKHFNDCPKTFHFHDPDEFRYELWDNKTGNIIEAYDSIDELVKASFRLGQANPRTKATFLSVIEPREFHEVS